MHRHVSGIAAGQAKGLLSPPANERSGLASLFANQEDLPMHLTPHLSLVAFVQGSAKSTWQSFPVI